MAGKIRRAARTPQWLFEYARDAESRGLKVIIAGAGGAAHLPGMAASLTLLPGDVLFLGDAPGAAASDGVASRALAGAPGYAFARVLVDSGGARHVPHYRAVDIASDNRIPPGQSATTSHQFSLPPACTDATVTARVLYRPLPLSQARLRGWTASDYLIADSQATITLP